MAQRLNFMSFVKTHGKVKLRPYSIGENHWTALLCQDSDGNETFVAPPKETNTVVNSAGKVLVDFNLPAKQIAAQIKAHKDDLVVLKGNKNWDSPEEEEIPVYTLVAKIDVEEVDIDLN